MVDLFTNRSKMHKEGILCGQRLCDNSPGFWSRWNQVVAKMVEGLTTEWEVERRDFK